MSRIQYFTINSLFILRIHYKFTIDLATSLWKNFVFREYTKNLLSFSWLNYQIANLLYIHFFSREWIMDSASVPQIHYLTLINHTFTIFFANSLWIYCLFHDFTIYFIMFLRVLSFLQIHYEFSIYFANPPWIRSLFR